VPADVELAATTDDAFWAPEALLREPQVHGSSAPPMPPPRAGVIPPCVEPNVPSPPASWRMSAEFTEKTVMDGGIAAIAREQYRRIAGVLHEAQRASGLRVIMVASAVANEGKTLTAVNLALTFSQSYRKRVLLIDGDLRRPTLHRAFEVESPSDVGDVPKVDRNGFNADGNGFAVTTLSPSLAILAGGDASSDPMAALTSDRVRQVVAEAKRTFDWVIFDTPPVELLPDAHLLASLVDGVVLVVRAGSTPHELVSRTVAALGKERIVGIVLNGVHADPGALNNPYHRDDATTSRITS
jgi:capsular exopolysaccharide synthesis family protein